MELASNLIGGLVVLAIVVYAAMGWRRRRSSPTRARRGDPAQFAEFLAPDHPGEAAGGETGGTTGSDRAPTMPSPRGARHDSQGPGPRTSADGRTHQDAGLPGRNLEPVSDEETDARADEDKRRRA